VSEIFKHLIEHVQDSKELKVPFVVTSIAAVRPVHIAGLTLNLSITKYVVFLWIAAALLIFFATMAARSNAKNRVPAVGETSWSARQVCARYIVVPNMDGRHPYMPYVLSTSSSS